MAVRKFCRITCSIAWDRALAGLIKFAVGKRAYQHRESERNKECMPERKQFPHIETQRKTDHFPALIPLHAAVGRNLFPFECIQIQPVIGCFTADRAFTAVSGDIAFAVGKPVDGQEAVISASIAGNRSNFLAE